MGQPFASDQHAIGNCDRCGFQYKLTELRSEVVDLHVTGFLVCSECWDPDQPQLQVGRWPVSDPQALRNPRPSGSIGGREIRYAYRTDFETGLDSWESVNGTLTWNSSDQTATLVSDALSSAPGDPWVQRGWNDDDAKIDYLSIDASEYKYVRALFKVNRFPDFEPDDRYTFDFQGDLFWSDVTGTGQPFPFSSTERVRASPLPVLSNSPVGTWYKLTWDVGSVATWTGTVTTLRLDFFDARNEEGTGPDYDAGEVEIAYIAVEKF